MGRETVEFLVCCSSGSGLRLAPPHDILRVEQMLSTAQEQETRMGDKQSDLGFWGNGRRNSSMKHPKAKGLQTAKQKVGEGGHLGVTCGQQKG